MGGLVSDWRRKPPKNAQEWLEKAASYSRPVCVQLCEWILNWEPDLTESIKWGALCFKGRRLVLGLGSFKRHAGLTFFRGAELLDRAKLFNQGEENASLRTIRFTSLDGVNRSALRSMIHAAVALDLARELPPPPKKRRVPMPVPDFFSEALKANPASDAGFKRLAPSYQREYINWLATAKRPETRAKRLAQTLKAVASQRKYADRNNG